MRRGENPQQALRRDATGYSSVPSSPVQRPSQVAATAAVVYNPYSSVELNSFSNAKHDVVRAFPNGNPLTSGLLTADHETGSQPRSVLEFRDLEKDLEKGRPKEKVIDRPPIVLSETEATTTSNNTSAELSGIYKCYVAYECILVNLLGFCTLFFQCELQDAETTFLADHPDFKQDQADILFGHFWLNGDLNCVSREAHCLTYMVTGWLMIAGILQVFINFDGIRQCFFPSDPVASRGTKIMCMYSFFLCDWYWVVLMYFYRDVVGYQQMCGSALDIFIRLFFVFKTSRMFKDDDTNDLNAYRTMSSEAA